MKSNESLKETKIFSLVLIPLLGQYVVTLEELSGQRLIPIWIGINEGNAIGLKLQGEELPRPMTHDLVAIVLSTLGAKADRVVVTDLKDGTYYAVLIVTMNGHRYEIDCRPSDAMAIAVRTESPIFVDEKVLKKCPVVMKPITDDEVEKFKQNLQNLKPEDFFKGLNETKESPDSP